MTTDRSKSRAGFSAAWGTFLAAVFFLTILAPGMAGKAWAAKDRFVLEYNDSHIRSHRGEPATLFLKKALRDQYPWVDVDDLELRRVVLIAKSRHGRGEAQLRVGHRMTDMYQVDGGSGRFHDDRRNTFDRIHFSNPSYDSNGPWQIDMLGNFIVNKVVLEVDNRQHRDRMPPRPYRF